MKYQKLEAFEKHFNEACPDHLSTVYLIICPRESERKKILAQLVALLEPLTDFKRCTQINEAIEHVNSGSLFSGKLGACLDGVALLLKTELNLLSDYLTHPNPSGHLLLGAASGKNLTQLYKEGKKELVLLDLSGEKPWEEKQRVQKWVVQTFIAKDKQIDPEAVELLLEQLPLDRLLLQQEIDKLVSYVGERKAIRQ